MAHVGVRRVTAVIVHIGNEEVVVVIHFCVAILFVIFCIRRCTLNISAFRQCFRHNSFVSFVYGLEISGSLSSD